MQLPCVRQERIWMAVWDVIPEVLFCMRFDGRDVINLDRKIQ